MTEHWFWFGITVLVVAWYSTITVWIAIRGAADIREMVANLDAEQAAEKVDESE